jgi:hypothetical protein
MQKHSFLLLSITLLAINFAAAQELAVPGIRTKHRLTILSANDGYLHRRLIPDNKTEKRLVTADSITVIHLGPDHPPVVKTVYGTVPNTIAGAPYMAMTGSGRYGFVTCRSGSHDSEAPDLLSVIDLSDADLKVVQTIKIPNPAMALMHPDGRRLLVPYDSGIQVFEMRDGRLELIKNNPTPFRLGGIAVTPKGDRIACPGTKQGEKLAVHVFSYRDGVVAYESEVKIQPGLPDWDGPFAFRFTPDGKRLVIPNGFGSPSKGKLDPILIADMTRDPPTVTEAIPQVADGIESVAIHPSGRFAVISCLDDSPRAAVHQANSHLAVVDLTSKPARLLYHLPVESLPEGIEFTPDGAHLFVQLTYAHRIAVFEADGFLLKRSPFVIRVGHGPSSMALGPSHGGQGRAVGAAKAPAKLVQFDAASDAKSKEDFLMTRERASAFAKLALKGIRKEYPNHPTVVLNGDADVKPPRQVHPAFFGCYDWHSSVHGHWMLVRLLRQYPDLPEAPAIREALRANLTADNLKTEADTFARPNMQTFERPYGWAWLLKLTEELHGWDDADGKAWAKNLRPLADVITARYISYFPKQTYPIRSGVHSSTAFGLTFALDYARTVGDDKLQGALVDRARTYFSRDADIPARWEPGGADFFSPSLVEADLMRRVLPSREFAVWLARFLPSLAEGEPASLLEPATVTDRTDPQIVHLDGLNLSRAWCMRGIAAALPAHDPARRVLVESARRHARTGLAHVASGDYAGEHWLASFAVYMLSTPSPE